MVSVGFMISPLSRHNHLSMRDVIASTTKTKAPPVTTATTTNRRFQIGPKLISYITSKYASKNDMIYDETLWAEIIEPMLPRIKEAGALRQVLSRVWNK